MPASPYIHDTHVITQSDQGNDANVPHSSVSTFIWKAMESEEKLTNVGTYLCDSDPATGIKETLHVPTTLCNCQLRLWTKNTLTWVKEKCRKVGGNRKNLTTAGEGTWMEATERGLTLFTRWQRTTPSVNALGKSSGNDTFNRFSIFYNWKMMQEWYQPYNSQVAKIPRYKSMVTNSGFTKLGMILSWNEVWKYKMK